MKYLPTVAGALLGLLFIAFASMVLFHLIPPDKMPPPTTPEEAQFMSAFGTTGYLTFVKLVELIGGILVMIPKTRNLGLLALGPVIINILAYHAFITKGQNLGNPVLIVICLLALYLLWVERKKFAGLIN